MKSFFLTQNIMEVELLKLFGKSHLAGGAATLSTTTMGGRMALKYEVEVNPSDG